MKNSKLMLAFGVAILAILGASAFAVLNNQTDSSEQPVASQSATAAIDEIVGADTSSTTYQQYSELKGEDYDRTFIANMIEHHRGAVDMAKLAQANASHQEIKDMAIEIINARTGEITNMEKWQKQWGYPVSSGEGMMDHSAMGMMAEMGSMTESLQGLNGLQFDKVFIEQMILHHQSALDMAAPGQDNAEHKEVKELTQAIVSAQTREITQMKQWQKAWGFSS